MPDAVLTFDPIGGYRHPDHIHQASILAFEKAGDPSFRPESGLPFKPRALFFLVFSHHLLRVAIRIMPIFGMDPRRFGRNKDVDLKALVEFDFPVHVRIDTSFRPGCQGCSRGVPCLTRWNADEERYHEVDHTVLSVRMSSISVPIRQ